MAAAAATSTRALAERVLTALYAREPHAKVVVAATGGGSSVAELLFRAGSSSTMLQFSVPYARASLQNFLQEPRDPAADHVPRAKLAQFCSQETAERMAVAAWQQAQDIQRHEREEDDAHHAHALPATLERFRTSVGVACTAALATNYEKKGPHQCFLSICKAGFAAADQTAGDSGAAAPVLRQQCETYHLNLSKTLKRTRNEEDHIVSHWLVYLLAKSTKVDPVATQALHEALLSEQHEDDKLTEVIKTESDGVPSSPSDPLADICAGSADQLTSVAFLSGADSVEDHPAVAVKNLDFRGVVLSGSFNPLHQGHVDLARAAQRLIKERSGAELPVAFEIAVSNADKGVIASSTVMQRVEQFTGASSSQQLGGLGIWPVLVTNATLFSQKASLLKGCAFVIGADTAVRIADKKYYDNDEHKMVLTLQQIARNDCFFIVAGRFDDKVANRYISAEEVLQDCIPAVFQDLFVPLGESVFRSDLSSTQIRNQMQRQN